MSSTCLDLFNEFGLQRKKLGLASTFAIAVTFGMKYDQFAKKAQKTNRKEIDTFAVKLVEQLSEVAKIIKELVNFSKRFMVHEFSFILMDGPSNFRNVGANNKLLDKVSLRTLAKKLSDRLDWAAGNLFDHREDEWDPARVTYGGEGGETLPQLTEFATKVKYFWESLVLDQYLTTLVYQAWNDARKESQGLTPVGTVVKFSQKYQPKKKAVVKIQKPVTFAPPTVPKVVENKWKNGNPLVTTPIATSTNDTPVAETKVVEEAPVLPAVDEELAAAAAAAVEVEAEGQEPEQENTPATDWEKVRENTIWVSVSIANNKFLCKARKHSRGNYRQVGTLKPLN